ncbi:MAG: hypothetical protein QNJ44_21425 [Rhodobacter sp.]|nr:hypothetical protein [Rhodobacter sp.]
MRVKQAIIHIGFPKAGSTSLQVTLAANRRLLRRHGLSYARFTREKLDLDNHSKIFITLFAKTPQRYSGNIRGGHDTDADRALFREQFEKNLATGDPVIFSGEDIFRLAPDELAAMQEDLARLGRCPRIIAFVRPPLEFLHSASQQGILAGASRPVPLQPLKTFYSQRLGQIRDVFPDAEFYPFNACKAHTGGPAGFFADLIRPGLAGQIQELRRGEAVSDNAVHLIRHLNLLIPPVVQIDGPKANPLRFPGELRRLRDLPGEKFYVRRSEMGGFYDQAVAENRWLAENLGPQFCDESLETRDGPVQWTGRHARELPAILRSLPRHSRIAMANYFAHHDDVPAGLKALARQNTRPILVRLRERLSRIGVLKGLYRRLFRRLRG